MYTLTGLEQGQTGGDCSGWEKDPESFSKRVADHYVRTVLKLGITVKRIYPHYSTGKDIMDVDFTDELTVAVSFRGIPNWVMAMRLRGKGLNCAHDVGVAGAAADVAGELVADVGLGRIWVLLEQLADRNDHPRCAKAAL